MKKLTKRKTETETKDMESKQQEAASYEALMGAAAAADICFQRLCDGEETKDENNDQTIASITKEQLSQHRKLQQLKNTATLCQTNYCQQAGAEEEEQQQHSETECNKKKYNARLQCSSIIRTGNYSFLRVFATLALVLLSCLLVVPTNALANCPNGCECDDDTLVVKCGEGTLDVLPIALNPSIQRLIIKNNKIKTIDSSIQFYAELKFLDLSFNDLVTIPQKTFAFQRKLQELHLNHNKIGQITNRTLINLSEITILNLRGNLLAELEDYTFSPLGKIEELNLGQNRISRIGAHAFDGLKNLKLLYLDDNTLTTVPAPDNFRAMPSLAELYLGTNSFMTIPNAAFQDLKGLTRLDLRGAGLHNLSEEAMKGLESVRYLDLSDNRLQHVPQTAFLHLERLEDLILGQNDFEEITSGSLSGLKNLRRLQITGAQRLRTVENGAFGSNTNLEYLNLSANKMLMEVQENAFTGLPHLKHIILKENQITSLAEGLFPWSDLLTFDLSDNPLVCDCRLLWLRNLLAAKNGSNEQIVSVACAMPANLKGEPLQNLNPAMLGCSHSDPKQQALIGILLVVTAATITALALIIYTCRRKIREMLKGHSALGRKEREYQKTFSDEDYIRQPQLPCPMTSSAPYSTTTSGYGQHALQYMGSRPIPVTEL